MVSRVVRLVHKSTIVVVMVIVRGWVRRIGLLVVRRGHGRGRQADSHGHGRHGGQAQLLSTKVSAVSVSASCSGP